MARVAVEVEDDADSIVANARGDGRRCRRSHRQSARMRARTRADGTGVARAGCRRRRAPGAAGRAAPSSSSHQYRPSRASEIRRKRNRCATARRAQRDSVDAQPGRSRPRARGRSSGWRPSCCDGVVGIASSANGLKSARVSPRSASSSSRNLRVQGVETHPRRSVAAGCVRAASARRHLPDRVRAPLTAAPRLRP